MSGRNKRPAALSVLGVMTGTSCDGLDAACVSFNDDGWRPMWTCSAPFPQILRKRTMQMQTPGFVTSMRKLMELNRDFGTWYGETLTKAVSRAPGRKPDIIANHGQTVAHFPRAKSGGMSLQLGDPSVIAHLTGLTVISDFRAGDIAAGGQGAPLVPAFHKLIAPNLAKGRPVAIHNIGGISNFTYAGTDDTILAFDTGPGNAWIDAAAERATNGMLKMDRDGKLSARGKPDLNAVKAILKHPFFSAKPPKSTGRDDFPFELLLKTTSVRGASLVATATVVTIESIARAYEDEIIKPGLPLDSIHVCGGGARNPVLLRGLSARLPSIRILPLARSGFDEQFIEAQAFAFLGFLSILGRPLGGSWTSVDGFAPPGRVTPGKNWTQVAHKALAFI